MSAFIRLRTVALVLSLGVAGCGGRAATLESGERQGPTVLEVINRAPLDMTIYVVRESGARDRLGMATALVTTRFRIPERHLFGVTTLRFEADPVGSNRVKVSERIPVAEGDTVVLEIPPG